MGLFNTLHLQAPCLRCGVEIPLVLQFKYAENWQHAYKINDQLRWNSRHPRYNDGKPGAAHVVISAISEDCPVCKHDGDDYLIHVYNDVLTSVEPDDQRYNFFDAKSDFLVLEQ
ncbi:hypothetical protein ACP8Y2_05030 [Herpetosiphon llansteffanensis]